MKKSFAIITLVLALSGSAFAQDAEELKRLNASIEDMIATQTAQQKRLQELATEIDKLHTQLNKIEKSDQSEKFATRDDLRTLAEKLKEVDQARLEDRNLILAEIRKLAKIPVAATPPPPKKAAPKEETVSAGPPAGSLEYVVQPGDTLSGIATGVNKQHGLKVTVDQILKANPKLDPKRMRVGQTIYIPGK